MIASMEHRESSPKREQAIATFYIEEPDMKKLLDEGEVRLENFQVIHDFKNGDVIGVVGLAQLREAKIISFEKSGGDRHEANITLKLVPNI